jgi:hypothetical protein
LEPVQDHVDLLVFGLLESADPCAVIKSTMATPEAMAALLDWEALESEPAPARPLS